MEPKFKAHLFVCTNDRGPNGKRPSCAHRGAQELRDKVKAACHSRGFGKEVRVNSSGCLDQCEQGISAVLYPSGRWFFNLESGDADQLVAAVEEELKK